MPQPPPSPWQWFRGNGRIFLVICGCILAVCFSLISLLRLSFVTYLDGRFYDGLNHDGPDFRKKNAAPVIVALDDASLARYGRWPWPRELMARLLTRIAAQKPAAVGIDVLFAEAERSLGEPLPGASPRLSGGDRALAHALTLAPSVPGFELTFNRPGSPSAVEPGLCPLNLAIRGSGPTETPLRQLWRANGAIGSLPPFYQAAGACGFLNGTREQDGVLRRMPVLMLRDEKVFPSLALATALRASGSPSAIIEPDWWGALWLTIGTRRVPLDNRGQLLLRYRNRHADAKPVSAADVLDGKLPDNALTGRVVLLGAVATGIGDQVTTPLGKQMWGVQVHAAATDNILNGDFARPAPWGYSFPVTLALGLLATLVCVRLPPGRGALLLAMAAAGAWFGSTGLFHASGLFLSPVFPLITLFIVASPLTLIRLFHTEQTVRHQSHDLAKARDFIMTSMAALAEIRDMETGGHIMRTQRYLHALCTEISSHPRFKPLLNAERIELISKLAVLHDIGKVGIDDKLLRKPARFTPDEYELVKKHATHGRDALARAELRVGDFSDEMLSFAKDIAYSHHERWDGRGYPEGLQGDRIPWAARLMAVADVYDALVSRRVYKEPIPHIDAVRIIRNGRGGQFDPDVVDAFLKVEDSWRQIAIDLDDSRVVKVEIP